MFTYPLDHGNRENITVRNIGNSYSELRWLVKVFGPGFKTGLEMEPGFSQPPKLYLNPGESQIIYHKMESEDFERMLG